MLQNNGTQPERVAIKSKFYLFWFNTATIICLGLTPPTRRSLRYIKTAVLSHNFLFQYPARSVCVIRYSDFNMNQTLGNSTVLSDAKLSGAIVTSSTTPKTNFSL